MGEFARFNGARIKIGTCENLYYLRWEDRFKVEYDFGNHKWNWRLPWPDEDQIKPGEYPDPFRGALLVDFTAPDGLAPGYIHIRHECGLLINAPCFHGRALPPPGDGMRVHWNGRAANWFHLAFVTNNRPNHSPMPVIQCRFCRQQWIADRWSDVLPHLTAYPDRGLRERLEAHSVPEPAPERAQHAWLSLTRLGGVNEKVPIERRGQSVYVPTPGESKRYRIDAATFDHGETQFRGSYAIRRWDDQAERTAAAEANWQT